MANSDIVITQSTPLGPPLLDNHKALSMLALGMFCLSNGGNPTTTTTQLKSFIASATNGLQGIPGSDFELGGKLASVFSALVWAAVNVAGASDLANSTITQKTSSVVYAYLTALDDDTLNRLILWEFGLSLSILT